MKNNWLVTIIIAIVVAAGGFYGGMMYQKNQAGNLTGNQFYQQFGQGNQRGQSGGGRGRFGGATVGTVVSQDANSLTVQLQDGSSKIINVTGSTAYAKSDSASKSDIQTGMRVAAFGIPNSDGSITASNVQLNPPTGMFRGGSRTMQGTGAPTQQ